MLVARWRRPTERPARLNWRWFLALTSESDAAASDQATEAQVTSRLLFGAAPACPVLARWAPIVAPDPACPKLIAG